MTEYLVYHGPFESTIDDPGLVSFKADGLTVTLRGKKSEVDEWANIVRSSYVLAATTEDGQVNLESFVGANKYSRWTWFTDNDFDEYKNLYDSVKGRTVVIKIKPIKDKS